VRNGHDFPIKVTVEDQLSVSENLRIRWPKDKGVVIWPSG
jgi:hypothetical protein